VQAGGPAERAGVKRGDVITAVNNQPVADTNNLRNVVASMAPGTTVSLKTLRDGREQNAQLTLAELPARPRSDDEDSDAGQTSGNEKFGLTLQPLTSDLASRAGLDATDQGLLVAKVDPNGAAADAGIRQGDLIVEVNRRPVRTFAEFSAAVQQSGQKPALLLVKRRNATIFVPLKPGA
jgi:serine protease Do